VLTGTSEPVRPVQALGDLIGTVALSQFSRAPTKFDPGEVMVLTGRILHECPYESISPRLAFLGLPPAQAEALWNAVHANLATLADMSLWKGIVFGVCAGRIEEPDYNAQAVAALPPEPWDETTWGLWTDALKASTGRKGKPLFMPLRQALTGLDHGPELKGLLPLMGRAKILARLRGQSA
jgi:glutamyl-tRNA synthetase